MKSRVGFLTSRRFQNLLPKLPWAACSTALLFGTAVYGQTTPPVPETPPPAQSTVPAEIQPGHPAKGNAAPGTPAGTGPFAPDGASIPSARRQRKGRDPSAGGGGC